jgi:hypothetical protein
VSEARVGRITAKRHRRIHQRSNIVSFAAQEFDAGLVNTYGDSSTKKFPNKDANGQDSAMRLRPNDVAGVFVTSSTSVDPEEMPITYKVAHYH